MDTRLTEGARREMHEKRETTTATENGISRSTDLLAEKLKSHKAYPIKFGLLTSCHFTLSLQREPIHSGNMILFTKPNNGIYNTQHSQQSKEE